ncbi:MAG: exosortase T [Nitrospinota bacterium]|nr:exosortase T [Nitrospinota bacterium]
MINARIHLDAPRFLPGLIFGTAAGILAYEPVRWLVQTWQDPAYDSKGFLIFLVCAGLFLWSVSSPHDLVRPANTRWAFILLAVTALIRLAGQVFAVNIIGALALVIDVYALATLAGVQHRKRPISPGWLAVCFLFALPLERVIQHTVGFGLQNLSAGSACLILGGLFDNVSCHGVRILINQKDVLVDLPCSGARTLLLLQLFYAACMTVCRPNLTSGLFGFLVTVFSSLWINIFRIMALAIGIAYPEMVFGADVMAEPGHSLLGLTALALGCLPILFWARFTEDSSKSRNLATHSTPWKPRFRAKVMNLGLRILKNHPVAMALGFLMVAGGIVSLPRTPIDVARPDIKIDLPLMIDNHEGIPSPLLPKEKAYFTQYGGAAAKASYGNNGLLLIQTSSPLRHLHSPDECLRGLGFEVRHVGISYDTIPTAVYKATTAEGQSYRVAVSFTSDRGDITSNVSEAVWRWMQKTGSVWSAIQRISPWEQDASITRRWDRAVLAALDLDITQRPAELTKER